MTTTIGFFHVEYCESVKYCFSYEPVVNKLKERKLFSNEMNSNHFGLNLARRHWDCSAKKNQRGLNSAAKKKKKDETVWGCKKAFFKQNVNPVKKNI